jgi:NADH:ubiquinone oxidoreductase subunit 5 (chain L)/Multisubunit Na+/H+ antiporter, MnhA subunit
LIEVINGKIYQFDVYTWMFAYNLKVGLGFLADPLSAAMITMVTCVSFLIHVYSVGYMGGDPGYYRFFCLYIAFYFLYVNACAF